MILRDAIRSPITTVRVGGEPRAEAEKDLRSTESNSVFVRTKVARIEHKNLKSKVGLEMKITNRL